MNKLLTFSSMLIALTFAGCSSDEPETPEPDTPVIERYSGYILYKEDLYSNPYWESRENTSPECLQWKNEHVNGKPYMLSENATRYFWMEDFDDATVEEIESKAVKFVNFTLGEKPNETTLHGLDIYSADVYLNDFNIGYGYSSPYYETNPNIGKWVVTYSTDVPDDSNLTPEFTKWAELHQGNLTYSSEDGTQHTWKFTNIDKTRLELHNDALEFIGWSPKIKNNGKRYYEGFAVTMHQVGSTFTLSYYKPS